MSVAALSIYNCTYTPPENVRMRLDGDTFRCQGNVSPVIPDAQMWIPKVRLVRVNAPETGKPGAEDARTELIHWLTTGPFNLVCFARDKYGRLLADAEMGQGLLSEHMLKVSGVVPMSVEDAKTLAPHVNPAIVLSIAHPSQIKQPEITP